MSSKYEQNTKGSVVYHGTALFRQDKSKCASLRMIRDLQTEVKDCRMMRPDGRFYILRKGADASHDLYFKLNIAYGKFSPCVPV